jgi:hypothetical protein
LVVIAVSYGTRERPMLLFEDGVPTALYTAVTCKPKTNHTSNLAQIVTALAEDVSDRSDGLCLPDPNTPNKLAPTDASFVLMQGVRKA